MADLIRDAPIGQIIRFITSNKVLQYPEEKPDFQCPTYYSEPEATAKAQKLATRSTSSTSVGLGDDPADVEKAGVEPAEPERSPAAPDREALERAETVDADLERAETAEDLERRATTRSSLARVGTKAALQQSHTRAELEAAFSAATLEKEPTRPIIPQTTSDGIILVDWYNTDDPDNPQNWSLGKKSIASFQICIYTLAVYMVGAVMLSKPVGRS